MDPTSLHKYHALNLSFLFMEIGFFSGQNRQQISIEEVLAPNKDASSTAKFDGWSWFGIK